MVGVRAGRGAGAGAGGAEDGGVDGEVLGGAEDGLVELELDRDERVAPGAGAAARAAGRRTAEERVHDVAEAAETGAAEADRRAPPPVSNGSPPRSTMRRFSGSVSAS